MTRNEFRARLQNSFLQLDGATGTELAKRGMPPGICPESWVLEHPEALIDVQRAYAEAGSDILYAPSFGANEHKLAEFGLESRAAEINTALARLSRQAVSGKLVFGDIAPTGLLVEPFGELPFEEAVAIYRRQAEALVAGGVDGFAIETMMDLQEARAALIGIRECCDLPVIVTLTFEPGGRTLTGTHPVSALAALQALGADAFGCNCSTGPREMAELIRELKPYAEIPLAAKPNAGMPRLVDGRTLFDLGPDGFAEAALLLADAGANLLGGCCGTTPAHLAALHKRLREATPKPVHAELRGLVSSPSRFRRLAVGEPFAMIGERINPTGKKALQAELRAGSFELVREFAREQAEQGAELLDVNFGLAGIDETAMMARGVDEAIRVAGLPLAIDSTDPAVVERALRRYPGRALLNSISAEKERLEKVLPIAARYGAMLILLPLEDAGIPETLEGRLRVLDTILAAAARHGYRKEDCVADALLMTISAGPGNARLSLDFIEACARERGLATTCGLSNISFGLPARPTVNLAFLGMAEGRGLTSAIINPGAPGVADAVAAGNALLDLDPRLEQLLARHAKTPAATAACAAEAERPAAEALFEAVLRGKREAALRELERALAEGAAPKAVVDDILIPAITEVGRRFETKEYFLPQLTQSAAAMQEAMARLEPLLLAARAGAPEGPVFLLATVKGDIHDIGKNIVALLLKNHGFRVVDLGKDVPAETIVREAAGRNAAVIGLSALMTTTMPQMKTAVDLLRERGIQTPVIVGGAAVDGCFAESIGALYAADAMATVRIALALR